MDAGGLAAFVVARAVSKWQTTFRRRTLHPLNINGYVMYEHWRE